MSSMPTGWAPWLVQPPIERIPDRTAPGPAPLHELASRGTLPWGGVPMVLPPALTAVLWSVLSATAGFGTWLTAVRFGGAPCSGLPCTIALTGGHPGFLLLLAGSAVVVLGGATVVTRGFTEAAAMPLALTLVGAMCGLLALAGVAAMLLGGLALLATAAWLVLIVVDHL